MTNNRFQGVLATNRERNEASYNGLYASRFNEILLNEKLSEDGAALDFGASEDYSVTATFFSFIVANNQVVNRVVLQLEDGSVAQNVTSDAALWLGGAAALTNGIVFQVRDVDDTVIFSYGEVKSVADFSYELGAEVHRDLAIGNSTAGNNHDSVIVTIDFEKILGAGLRLRVGDKIGFYLNDDLSALGVFTGSIFGHKIFI